MRSFRVLVAIAVGVFPVTVCAQDSRLEVARRDLLERAEQARSSGDHATALRLAIQAAQIRQTPSLRLMLAQEQRAAGHLVEALDNATACVREAQADPSLRNREHLMEVCRTLTSEVEPSIGRLTVRVTPASASGLRVRVGDADLPMSLLGVASPMMPGRVTVHVEATGFRASSREALVAAGREAQVDIALGAEDAPHSNAVGERVAVAVSADARTSASSGPGAGPWVAVGVGTAGLATGLALFLMSNSARDERDQCRLMTCLETATQSNARYETLLTGANVAFGVGGAVAAAGLFWWILAPRGSGRPPASAMVVPQRDGVSLQIGGRL